MCEFGWTEYGKLLTYGPLQDHRETVLLHPLEARVEILTETTFNRRF